MDRFSMEKRDFIGPFFFTEKGTLFGLKGNNSVKKRGSSDSAGPDENNKLLGVGSSVSILWLQKGQSPITSNRISPAGRK